MRKYYFSIISILVLLLSLLAFSDNLITDIGQESNRDPKFVILGVIMLLWMFIFVVQTSLIRKDDQATHRKLGILGMIVAIGVVLSTFYLFYATYNGWSNLVFYAKPNRFLVPSFAILIFLAYRYRRLPERHKRLILVANLLILEPILSRSTGFINVSQFITIPLVWNAFFISLFVYDWTTSRKIHFISYMGLIWLYAVWAICALL